MSTYETTAPDLIIRHVRIVILQFDRWQPVDFVHQLVTKVALLPRNRISFENRTYVNHFRAALMEKTGELTAKTENTLNQVAPVSRQRPMPHATTVLTWSVGLRA